MLELRAIHERAEANTVLELQATMERAEAVAVLEAHGYVSIGPVEHNTWVVSRELLAEMGARGVAR